jgi:hypothetical protein
MGKYKSDSAHMTEPEMKKKNKFTQNATTKTMKITFLLLISKKLRQG